MENVFTALCFRSQWEDITKSFRFSEKSRHEGTIDNLVWFLNEGKKSNGRRKHYNEAVYLAEVILGLHDKIDKETKSCNKSKNQGELVSY
jgi:hypothetical protein